MKAFAAEAQPLAAAQYEREPLVAEEQLLPQPSVLERVRSGLGAAWEAVDGLLSAPMPLPRRVTAGLAAGAVALGGGALAPAAEAKIVVGQGAAGVKLGETTADHSFTVEAVYCLGNCALSPSAMLDGRPYGRVSPQVADFLIDSARRHS